VRDTGLTYRSVDVESLAAAILTLKDHPLPPAAVSPPPPAAGGAASALSVPSGEQSVNLSAGAVVTGIDFGDFLAQLGTTTTVSTDHSSGSTYGQAVTFTATVSPAAMTFGMATGSVQFQIDSTDFGSPVGLTNGTASITATLPAGSHNITATYASDTTQFIGSSTTTAFSQAVTPAHLTITADNKGKVYGASLPALTFTLSGFVNGDTASVVSGSPTLTTTATSASGVGSYPITVTDAGSLSASNYDFPAADFVNGTLTVTQPSTTATAGNNQSATVNTAFASALQASVTDASGNPIAGVPVTFTAPASGAGGTFAAGAGSVTATTDASGIATASTFTAGTIAGSYSVTVSIIGVATSATFTLSNNPGSPAAIAAAGSGQSATVNTAFGSALQATVTDAYGNPIPGVVVTFAAPTSGATGTFAGGAGSVTVTTDVGGIATASTFTAGTVAGNYTVTASVSGVTTAATFTLSNDPGSPAGIAATAGSGQSATVNTAFATALQATVTDAYGNLVPGVTVSFAAPNSGASGTFPGSAGSLSVTTDASGIATASTFTAGTVAGAYTVTATVTGVTTTANFTLNNNPGSPAAIAATAGSGQSATVNTAFATTLQATVTDAYGNPVPGVAVNFAAPTSGAGGTFAGGVGSVTATTNGVGIATASAFTAGTVAGSYSVTATVTGVSSSANFGLSNTAGSPAAIATAAGSGQSATVNTAFATALQASVTDIYGNPVPGVTVTFAAPATGARGTFAGGVVSVTASTNAAGIATASTFTAGTIAGNYTVSASVSGVATSAYFSLSNTPGSPASIVATAGSSQKAVINAAFAAALQATVTDTYGNPVAGATVTFAAPASGASGSFPGPVNSVSITTNASGLATAPTFTANGVIGTYNVKATVVGVATSASFSLSNTAAPTHLAFGQQPTSTIAGAALSPAVTVRLLDASNNVTGSRAVVTLTIASGPTGGTLSGTTSVTAVNGIATFANLVLTKAGSYTLKAASTGLKSVTSASFTITAAAASSFSVTGFPSSTTAGTSKNFTVTVLDPYGNTATSYRGTVQFSSSDPQAALPANYMFTATDAGKHTFSAALKTAGTQSLTATDTSNTNITGAEKNIAVSPAAASKFLLALILPAGATNVTAGTPFNLTVTVVDAYGNVVPTYPGTVNFSDSVGSATLPANYTFTTGTGKDNGVHTFTSLVLRTKGVQTLTVTDIKKSALLGSVIVDVF
jgi:protocatechuate 3,4-dioxygenase beta subunit